MPSGISDADRGLSTAPAGFELRGVTPPVKGTQASDPEVITRSGPKKISEAGFPRWEFTERVYGPKGGSKYPELHELSLEILPQGKPQSQSPQPTVPVLPPQEPRFTAEDRGTGDTGVPHIPTASPPGASRGRPQPKAPQPRSTKQPERPKEPEPNLEQPATDIPPDPTQSLCPSSARRNLPLKEYLERYGRWLRSRGKSDCRASRVDFEQESWICVSPDDAETLENLHINPWPEPLKRIWRGVKTSVGKAWFHVVPMVEDDPYDTANDATGGRG
jgi:hypothetical protein